MTKADSSQTRLAYVAESTEGTTPASPAFQILRMTGESLAREAEKIVSDEITSHRNVTDQILVGRMANGSINGELSYGTYDDLLEGAFCSSWAGDEMVNGVERKPFTFEKTFEQGAQDSYIRYVGSLIDTFTLELTAKEIATVEFGILGRGGSSGVTILSGATYTAASSTEVLNAASHVGTVEVVGVSPDVRLRSLTLNIANNLREQPEVGSLDLCGVGLGRFEVTGSMDAYFENVDLYEAIHANTTLALNVTIGASGGSQYNIFIPSLKIMDGEPAASGNDEDVMLPLEFRGIYNTSESPSIDGSIRITRNV